MIGILLVALLTGSARAADTECPAAYKTSFADGWGITRADWDAACRGGEKSDEILRRLQAAAIANCTARFQSKIKEGKINEFKAAAFCARGRSGENALSAELGMPGATAKPAGADNAAPLRPGPAFYQLVLDRGQVYPKTLGAPHPTLPEPAGDDYMHFTLRNNHYFVPIRGGSGTCVVDTSLPACTRLNQYTSAARNWPDDLLDDGCTGLLSTQRPIWGHMDRTRAAAKKAWSQSRADEMYAILSYAANGGCD